jgi:hypothetical protein
VEFPGDPHDHPVGQQDWWLCDACRLALLGPPRAGPVLMTTRASDIRSEPEAGSLSEVEDKAVSYAVAAAYDVARQGEPVGLSSHDLLRRLPRSRRVLEVATTRVKADVAANPDSIVLQRAAELLEVVHRIGLFY